MKIPVKYFKTLAYLCVGIIAFLLVRAYTNGKALGWYFGERDFSGKPMGPHQGYLRSVWEEIKYLFSV
jgi:hypothetical protein